MAILRPPSLHNQSTAQYIPGSTLFDQASSEYLNRTPGTEGNRRCWTVSFWVKRAELGDTQYIFESGTADTAANRFIVRFDSGDTILCTTGQAADKRTTAVYRDVGAWGHFVLAVNTALVTAADRFKLYWNGERITSFSSDSNPSQNFEMGVNDTTPQNIGRSEVDGSVAFLEGCLSQFYLLDGQPLGPEYFGYRDPLTNTWRPKQYTQGVFKEMDKWTCDTYDSWNSGQTALRYQGIKFLTSDGGKVGWLASGTSNTGLNVYTSTDNSTWTRKLSSVTVDSTTGLYYESSEQYVIIVNGSDANWSNEQVIISDQNGAKIHYSNGTWPGNGTPTMSWTGPGFTDGTLASYNSVYLPLDGTGFSAFQTAGNMGQDQSGLKNDYSVNNTPTFITDSPSGVTYQLDTNAGISTELPSNYATLNPLFSDNWALTEGNLKAVSSGSYGTLKSTIAITSGKFYAETTALATGTANACGIARWDHNNSWPGASSDQVAYAYLNDGRKATTNDTRTTYGSTWQTVGDIIGIAFDATNGTISFYNNGVDQGVAYTGIDCSEFYPFYICQFDDSSGSNSEQRWNFGQKPFNFAPPEGYLPLCAANLSGPGVARPDQYFSPTTYDGSGGTGYFVNTPFQPDMTWIKQTNGAAWWVNADSVRGAGKLLSINDGMAQADDGSSATAFSGFGKDGFYVGSVGGWYTNTLNDPYASYNWKAGGNKGTFNKDDVAYASAAAAGLDGGSTSPAASSVGTKQGFSILQWTATGSNLTISHGLTEAPEFVILKNVSVTSDYWTYHVGVNKGVDPEDYYVTMNEGTAMTDAADAWQDTKPTASLLTIGSNYNIANTGNTIMAYVWHSIPGVQKFGYYKGNGNADGPYVRLGFKPSFLIYKKASSGTEDWQSYDDKQNPYNLTNQRLRINNPTATDTGNGCDLLSDGFKLRSSDSADNSSDACYIYCAWSAEPFHNLYGTQSTAR